MRETLFVKRQRLLLVEVILTGRSWDCTKAVRGEFKAIDITKEYSTILSQIIFREKALKDLYNQLRRWLRTPIKELNHTPLETRVELSGMADQKFEIGFELTEEYMRKTDHPLCRINYKCDRISGECTYVVDQSCIQIFVDDLAKYFGSENRHSRPNGKPRSTASSIR